MPEYTSVRIDPDPDHPPVARLLLHRLERLDAIDEARRPGRRLQQEQ